MSERFDVAVIGGGLAGQCLTRLLQREHPGASVVVLERAERIKRKVGESTVEIGAHFLHERLGLADRLAETQLPKNGLRFWFDDEEHTLGFREASEDGPATYAYFRAYQLERETLEADLERLNQSGGATILRGVRALGAERAEDGTHQVRYRQGGEEQQLEARWLVDATGFRGLLSDDNLEPEPRLDHSAAWGWFRGGKKLDDLLQGTEHQRFIFSDRFLSTNHLLNEGYWIWVIPLASGLLSVGVGWDENAAEVLPEMPKTQEQLREFLLGHEMLRELIGEAEMEDFGSFHHMARRPKRFVSPEREAWIGTAAGFVDPFFSNGIDMIGLGCEAACDAIGRDLAGQLDPARIEAHNEAILLYFEHYVLSVAGLYRTFASQELSVLRYRREVHVYWALYTWAYLNGQVLEPESLSELRPALQESHRRDRFFTKLMRGAYRILRERGDLRRFNKGRYTFNQLGWRFVPYVRFEQYVGGPMDLARSREAIREIDTGCLLAILDVLFDGDRSPQSDLMFQALHGEVYERFLARSEEHEELDQAFYEELLVALNGPLAAQLAAEGVELGERALTPARFSRAFHGLSLGLEPEQAAAVRRRFNSKPRLTDFSDLPRDREKVQRRVPFGVEHTPWMDEPPTFRSIYDLLGDEWWGDEAQPFAVLKRVQAELAESAARKQAAAERRAELSTS